MSSPFLHLVKPQKESREETVALHQRDVTSLVVVWQVACFQDKWCMKKNIKKNSTIQLAIVPQADAGFSWPAHNHAWANKGQRQAELL